MPNVETKNFQLRQLGVQHAFASVVGAIDFLLVCCFYVLRVAFARTGAWAGTSSPASSSTAVPTCAAAESVAHAAEDAGGGAAAATATAAGAWGRLLGVRVVQGCLGAVTCGISFGAGVARHDAFAAMRAGVVLA